jgi:fumarate reductase subunit C
LRRLPYAKFITRELTSLAVGYTATLLVIQIWAMGQGEETYQRFLGWLEHPVVIAVHVIVVAGLLFHTVTWLNLAPKALVVRLGQRRVPDAAVVALHYAGLLLATALVAWLLIGRS